MTIATPIYRTPPWLSSQLEPFYSGEGRDWLREIEESRKEMLIGSATRSEAFDALHEVAELAAADDWDGLGSLAVPSRVVSLAETLLEALPQDAPSVDISATNSGEILFEWGVGSFPRVAVKIRKRGDLAFASVSHQNHIIHGTADFSDFAHEILPKLGRIAASERGRSFSPAIGP